MSGFEFGIDPGDGSAFNESKLIVTQIETLLYNGYISNCKEPYGALIVLAANLTR